MSPRDAILGALFADTRHQRYTINVTKEVLSE
jgi:hypothetical protein